MTPEQLAAQNCPNTGPLNFQDSRYRLEDYGLLSGTVRYDSSNGRWSATVYCSNLTDEVYANNAAAFGRGFWTTGGGLVGINDVHRNAISPSFAAGRASMG